jgi:hypothetical protein
MLLGGFRYQSARARGHEAEEGRVADVADRREEDSQLLMVAFDRELTAERCVWWLIQTMEARQNLSLWIKLGRLGLGRDGVADARTGWPIDPSGQFPRLHADMHREARQRRPHTIGASPGQERCHLHCPWNKCMESADGKCTTGIIDHGQYSEPTNPVIPIPLASVRSAWGLIFLFTKPASSQGRQSRSIPPASCQVILSALFASGSGSTWTTIPTERCNPATS